jgi:cell division protein FtsB
VNGPSHPDPDPAAPSDERAGSAMFWVLIALAAAAFAPCVILPAWRDYQSVARVEQQVRADVQRAAGELERQRRRADALRRDPAVIARVAQRELGYSKPGHVSVNLGLTPPPDAAILSPVSLDPIEPPPILAGLVRRLPSLNYDAVFCDGPTRAIIMVLAGGLVMAAFVLYPPRRSPRAIGQTS